MDPVEQIRVQKLLDGFKNGTASLEVSTHAKETQTKATSTFEPKRFAENSTQTEEVGTDNSRFFKEILDNLKTLHNKVENNSKFLENLVPEKLFRFNNENLFDDYSFNDNKDVQCSPPINTPPFIDSLEEVLSLRPSQNLNSISSVPPPSSPATSLPSPSSNPATSLPPLSQNLDPATSFLPRSESLIPATSLPLTSKNRKSCNQFPSTVAKPLPRNQFPSTI